LEQSVLVKNFECDLQHRWKPASFFQHLTEAAGLHAKILGCGYEAMLAQNLFWVLSRIKIKFISFPTTGDQVTIRTWPKTIQQKLFYIRDFEILDAEGQPLALATSAWLVVDAASRRLLPPQSLQINLPALSDRIGLAGPLEKIGLSQTGMEQLQAQATYSTIDVLGHVNNSRYVEWICDAIPLDVHRQKQLDWIQVNYDREVQPGDQVSLLVESPSTQPDRWTVEGINRTSDSRAFEAALQWRENQNQAHSSNNTDLSKLF
jgi:medium-chain acyl-[acyl-carrier-protein] hydrolase